MQAEAVADFLIEHLGGAVWTLVLMLGPVAAGHALLNKRDPRAALGWIVVSVAFPLFGPLFYWIFGINRIRTRARALGRVTAIRESIASEVPYVAEDADLASICRVGSALTTYPLTGGNVIEPLHNGENAFPPMLDAIRSAERSILLSTYIFETNRTGGEFIAALDEARERGVDVRVIVDGVGALYSFPTATRRMRKLGIPVEAFLPPRIFPPKLQWNLRNHRKILVVDGSVAFTGGMNIGDRHLAADESNPDRVVDLHFRVEGPLVQQIEQTFLEDWSLVSGTSLERRDLDRETPEGPCQRVIVDGPDDEVDRLATIIGGAVSVARERICIMTPYFIPPRALIADLQVAALRGVDVTVILPGRNNLNVAHWATRKVLWELLRFDVKVYYQPPPFVHTKLLLVDEAYALFGSANIDSRSLRLNFELTIESFDALLASQLESHFDDVLAESTEVTYAEIEERPLFAKLRDGLAWLFSPYM